LGFGDGNFNPKENPPIICCSRKLHGKVAMVSDSLDAVISNSQSSHYNSKFASFPFTVKTDGGCELHSYFIHAHGIQY